MLKELVRKQKEHTDSLNGFIMALRAERHDFINHFTVLGGLLSLEKPELASHYLKEVLNQTKINIKIMALKQPVLIALLNGKIARSNQKGIDFQIEIKSSLENLPINHTDITAIFGNLIDNAIEAAILEKNKKFVSFKTSEDSSTYKITVSNSGPDIPEDIEKSIFAPGFSTKGQGRGFGLSIVLKVVEKYGGVILIASNPTAFNVVIPKKVMNND
ncbi:sensor histidine kinase [Desulfocucumis palustris]|nr:GHKL domain-containing protein [Desulfocucumis palustris]